MSQRNIPKIDILMMILKRLEEGSRVTTDELAQELSVTERSVFRYLETLQSAGYPIYFDRKQKTYKFVETFKFRYSGSFDGLTDALELKRKIFGSSSVGIATFRVNGNCVWANSAFAGILDTTLKQILKQSFISIPSWHKSGLYDLINDAIQSQQEQSRELHLISTPVKELWAHCTVSPFTSNDQRFVHVMVQDISSRKKKELALASFAASISKVPNLVIITDLNGTIEYVSDKILETTGYSREEVLGKTPGIFKSGFTPHSVYENMWETITSGLEWTGELCNRRKGGSTYWEHISISPIFDTNSNVSRFVAVKEDVTRQKLLEEMLYRHATSDSLTGLYNRRMTIELGDREIRRALRHNLPLSLVIVDINDLKQVNERYGHAMGDTILCVVARALQGRFHPCAILGRTGGDEFAIMLAGEDATDLEHLVSSLDSLITGLDVTCQEQTIRCAVSIGVAALDDHLDSCDALLEQARRLAYQAKRAKGGSVILAHKEDPLQPVRTIAFGNETESA